MIDRQILEQLNVPDKEQRLANLKRIAAETVFPVSEYREEPEETAVSSPEPETAAEPSGARIPPEDMQRLMSSAGQSLRAVDIDRR